MSATRVSAALRRAAVLQNHMHSNALQPHIVIPDTAAELPNSYSMEMHVDHDAGTVHFRTKMMSLYERVSVFVKQKNEMRKIYPDYYFTEKHS